MGPVELTEARRAAGLTQSELADQLGVARSYIGHCESGRRCLPASRAADARRALARGSSRHESRASGLLQAAAAAIVAEPGLTRALVVRRLGQRKGAAAAITTLIERGEVHERWHYIVDGRSRSRRRLGLFPGPADSLFAPEPEPAPNGAELRREREALGLTQTELARRLNVSPALVGHWESGRQTPSAAHRARIEQALQPSGAQLRALRESHGWSQRAIALQLRVQPSSWCLWESGKRPLSRKRWHDLRRELDRVGAAPPGAPLERAIAHLVAATERHAGHTRSFILGMLNSPHGDDGLVAALERQLVHERELLVEQRGPHRETQRRIRLGLFPGPPTHDGHRPSTMSGDELRERRHALRWTQARLAEELGLSEELVRRWERIGVSPGRVEQVHAFFERQPAPASDKTIIKALRQAIVKHAEREPGRLNRFEIAWRLTSPLLSRLEVTRHLPAALELALSSGEVHERVVPARSRGRTRIGLFAGLAPQAWAASEPLSGRELAAARAELKLTQRELGQLLGTSQGLITMWEQGRQPIPTARRAQLRRELKRDDLAPLSGHELREARTARGASQAALARTLGVSQATVCGWENGAHIPLGARHRLNELLRSNAPVDAERDGYAAGDHRPVTTRLQ